MVEIVGPPRDATRNKPITPELRAVLETAAEAAGIDAIVINSGGQDALGEGTRRTGSTRHDRGRAADLRLFRNSRVLSFSDRRADPAIEAFVTAAAAAGANGIGAGVAYMGPETLHIGFGTSPSDHAKIVWGVRGSSATAPAWLRRAAESGWSAPAPPPPLPPPIVPQLPGRYVVAARGGLHLRKGPGLEFGITRTLDTGTEVSVVAFDGAGGQWARVDLEDDGLIDGHLFLPFLKPVAAPGEHAEGVEEPD